MTDIGAVVMNESLAKIFISTEISSSVEAESSIALMLGVIRLESILWSVDI